MRPAAIWSALVRRSRALPPRVKVVALALAASVPAGTREAYLDPATLPREAGCTPAQAASCVTTLVGRGWLGRGRAGALQGPRELLFAGFPIPNLGTTRTCEREVFAWAGLVELGFAKPSAIASLDELRDALAVGLERSGRWVITADRRRAVVGPRRSIELVVAAEALLEGSGGRLHAAPPRRVGRPRVERSVLAAWEELVELGVIEARELQNTNDAVTDLAAAIAPFGWSLVGAGLRRWAVNPSGQWMLVAVVARDVARQIRAARAKVSSELGAIFGVPVRGEA